MTKEVFARPVFSAELLTPEAKKKFDDLPAWQRHLVKRIIDHGDLMRAAEEAGVARHAKDAVDVQKADQKSIDEALDHGGITTTLFVAHLIECLEARTTKFDKHQNAFECVDHSLKLKTLQFIAQLRGWLDGQRQKPPTTDLFRDTPT